jgi:serpin B
MHQRLKAHAAAVHGLQVVELPYGHSGSLAFDLLLPDKPGGLPELEAALTPDALDAALGALAPAQVTLSMPRFTERSQFSLQKPLPALGLGDLFGSPDLSAMTHAPVQISAVIHQAFVDVNEKGTEAAAATAVMGTRALQRLPNFTITADHPFLFLIRDTATGGILFFGRLEDPRH